MKDILDKDYRDDGEIISDLQVNFYPECEIISRPNWVKGLRKYEWFGTIVFKYFGQLYLVDIDAIGNGGWLGIDSCRVSSINKVKMVKKTVEEVKYEIA